MSEGFRSREIGVSQRLKEAGIVKPDRIQRMFPQGQRVEKFGEVDGRGGHFFWKPQRQTDFVSPESVHFELFANVLKKAPELGPFFILICRQEIFPLKIVRVVWQFFFYDDLLLKIFSDLF